MKKLIFESTILFLSPLLFITGLFAQETLGPFTYYPNPASGVFLGQAIIDGFPAEETDVIAAFDSDGNCAGAGIFIINSGAAWIYGFNIYGDDDITPDFDEGMNPDEDFTLKLWDSSEDTIIDYPESFSGWYNNNGAAMEGFNNPYVIYHFSSGVLLPIITAITDVPGDQGGWVMVNFTKSFYDQTDPNRTEAYYVQRHDGDLWTSVGSSPALNDSLYQVQVMTLIDSTSENEAMTEYRVVASMDEGTWISEPGWGYSVDNIAPEAPTGLTADGNGLDGIELGWDESEALDFNYFRIYRDTTQGFTPTTPLAEIVETMYTDTDADIQETYYYRISSVDTHDNESDFSDEVSSFVLSIEGRPLPFEFALHQNYPNPFNPVTSLSYDLPEQAQVMLTIYDLMGREVAQLVNNTAQGAGYGSTQWNATDMHGKPVSAGVYLYQIRAGEFVQTKKMVLLK